MANQPKYIESDSGVPEFQWNLGDPSRSAKTEFRPEKIDAKKVNGNQAGFYRDPDNLSCLLIRAEGLWAVLNLPDLSNDSAPPDARVIVLKSERICREVWDVGAGTIAVSVMRLEGPADSAWHVVNVLVKRTDADKCSYHMSYTPGREEGTVRFSRGPWKFSEPPVETKPVSLQGFGCLKGLSKHEAVQVIEPCVTFMKHVEPKVLQISDRKSTRLNSSH